MTPLEYATLCAKKYAMEKHKLEELVKGRGHEPREVVDRSKPFLALLQVCRICTERRGGLRPFVLTRILAAYRLDLLSAGLNPDGGLRHAILSKRHWHAARGFHRLRGELPPTDPVIAARVAGVLTRRENRAERELQSLLTQSAL